MKPEYLINEAGQAVRRTKYYSGGNRAWKTRPATRLDKRYGVAAAVQVLRELAATGKQYSASDLERLALSIEREGGDL